MNSRIILFFILFIGCIKLSYSQWTNLDTGINDNLTGVVVFENNGLVVGENGAYYTLNGGQGAENWTRFKIEDNLDDSLIYESTKFTHCFSNQENSTNSGIVYACGKNTLENRAVIFAISLPDLSYEIIYNGSTNSSLNKIKYNDFHNRYYAVGNNGLLLSIEEGKVSEITTNSNDDFNAITIDLATFWIGADGKILEGRHFDTNDLFLREYLTPNINNIDVDKDVSFNSINSVGKQYIEYNLVTGVKYRNRFDYGDLNANAILVKNDAHFVGTDHGIFRSRITRFQKQFLEWQPSSNKYFIKDLWSTSHDDSPLYACGKNGIVLKSSDMGGATKPYITLEGNGNCINSNISLDFFGGTSNSCSWTINGELVSSDCTDYRFASSVPGTFEVEVVGENSFGEQTSISKTIHIVDRPRIDLPVTISDDILCKSEPIEITIDNSEVDVKYYLIKEGGSISNNFGISPVGNGGKIILVSNPLDISGDYYIMADHELANCSQKFSDSFYIKVEKTNADFTHSLINVFENEMVEFNQAAVEANNFSWNFSPNALPQDSFLESQQVIFPDLGQTIVKLESWSDNNCYDDIEKEGPFVIEDTKNIEPCWSLLNESIEPRDNGAIGTDISSLSPTKDGFLVCGYYNDTNFNSKAGRKFILEGQSGGYLTKYDRNGVLRWIVHTKKSKFWAKDQFYKSVEDKDGNIYISGSSDGTFHDTYGNIIDLKTNNSFNAGFIIKLNSQGKFIWILRTEDFYPSILQIDKDNNLITNGNTYTNNNEIYLNGILSYTIDTTDITGSNKSILLKLSPNGEVIWNTIIANGGIIDIKTSDNAIYVTGGFKFFVDIYTANNPIPETVRDELSRNGNMLYLAKFNKDGELIWKLKSYSTSNVVDHTSPFEMVVDDIGNCYITGTNNTQGIGGPFEHIFENTDNTLTKTDFGGFFVAKINGNGICEWIRAGDSSYYGAGSFIFKKEDEICVLGSVADFEEFEMTLSFTGTSGKGIELTIGKRDHFMAVYNQEGDLLRIVVNGKNTPEGLTRLSIAGIFRDQEDNYYSGLNLLNLYDITYDYFGNVFPDTNGRDGIITRFKEECGIIYYPELLSVNDYQNVLADYKVFPNPTEGKVTVDFGEFKSNIDLTILDINGKVISSHSIINSDNFLTNIDGLAGSIYFIRVTDNNKMGYFKILKK